MELCAFAKTAACSRAVLGHGMFMSSQIEAATSTSAYPGSQTVDLLGPKPVAMLLISLDPSCTLSLHSACLQPMLSGVPYRTWRSHLRFYTWPLRDFSCC